MSHSSDNVIRADFGNRRLRDSAEASYASGSSVSSEVGESVSSDCVRVLEMPDSFAYRVRFDRIPDYDRHAREFFANMAKSGIVTALTDDVEDPVATAVLEVTEPTDGEVFRISLDEFVRYVHPSGELSSSEEKETFFRDAMDAHGLLIETRDKDFDYASVSSTFVTEESFDSFVPEAMFVTSGSESGFPTVAIVSAASLDADVHTELSPNDFVDPSRITLLHLVMHLVDDYRQGGEEIPEDATIFIMKRAYERDGAFAIPFRLVRKTVLAAIDRSFPLYGQIRDEEERVFRFFKNYVIPELAPLPNR